MICKTCQKKHHVCSSCGVENWYYTYCSSKCLAADGAEVCEGCNGWGYDHEDDDNSDEYASPCGGEGFIKLQ